MALHQAVLGLRAREADMSVVSGCNLMLAADQFKTFSSMGLLSPDGVSYAFDSRANGYGRGEGVGTLVIKRLRYDPFLRLVEFVCLSTNTKPCRPVKTEMLSKQATQCEPSFARHT